MNDTPDAQFDVKSASVARAYDYLLGGKDNFDVDRQFAESLLKRDPQLRTTAQLNKDFGRRSTDYIARQGVRQFLDLGSGIPTSPPSTHDTARRVEPDAKVVYVDHDPVVAAHNRALRAAGSGLSVIQTSFVNAEEVCQHPELMANIDFGEPVAILGLSIFQNTAYEEVLKVLRAYRSHLVPGSYLAISHVSGRAEQSFHDKIAEAAEQYGYPAVALRSDDEVTGLFEGFDLVEPGLVDYRDWHPSEAEDDARPHLNIPLVAAVGRLE